MKNFIIKKAKKAKEYLMQIFKKVSDHAELITNTIATSVVCMICIFASYSFMIDELRLPMESPVVHASVSSGDMQYRMISFDEAAVTTTASTTITTLTTTSTSTSQTTTTTSAPPVTTTLERTKETTVTTTAKKQQTSAITTTVESTFIPNTSGDQIYYYEEKEGLYDPVKGVNYEADKARYHEALNYITESERILLCNLVGREYGAVWVPIEEKAKVVACVMNRVSAGSAAGYRDSVAEVIAQKGQFPGYLPNSTFTFRVIPSVVDAVDYYFAHQDSFGNIKSFTGDGKYNHFR